MSTATWMDGAISYAMDENSGYITAFNTQSGEVTVMDPNGNILAPSTLAAMDTSNPTNVSWLDSLISALPAVSTFITSQQLAQINIERARKGMPALNPAQYAPQVGVGLNPQTRQMLMWGALGLGAFLLLKGRQ